MVEQNKMETVSEQCAYLILIVIRLTIMLETFPEMNPTECSRGGATYEHGFGDPGKASEEWPLYPCKSKRRDSEHSEEPE